MRLITRADLDGLTCAVLLSQVVAVDEIDFAHPRDVQEGKLDIGPNDVLANLPRDPRAAMVFDHHASEREQWVAGDAAKGAYLAAAPSAARVIAEHYPDADFSAYEGLLEETDRLDAAELDPDDVSDPCGWILLGYTLDPRTGMARYRDYFRHVLELVKAHPDDPDAVLADPEVQSRVAILREQEAAFVAHLRADSRQDGNVVITDVRGKSTVPLGNRFLVYTLFPTANVSIRIANGADPSFVTVQVGHSIFNRTCRTSVGPLLATYGGGGHAGAGTAQPSAAEADRVVAELVATLKKNG